MRARVIAEKCIGCGLCAEVCSRVFRMAGDKAVVQEDPIGVHEEKCCRYAAKHCPTDAIAFIETGIVDIEP